MRGIYAIADLGALDRMRLDPEKFVEAVLVGGVQAVQLRGKRVDGARMLGLLRRLVPRAKEHGVPLYANDRADIAILAGCDGVHVGQSDLAPSEVRSLADRLGVTLAIGLSTHDETQIDRALAEPIDYAAVGPVFGTVSKEHPDPVLGLDRALAIGRRARAKRDGLPLVAIGGIGIDALPKLAGAFDAVAVISALLPTSIDYADVEARARAMSRAFAKATEVARPSTPPRESA